MAHIQRNVLPVCLSPITSSLWPRATVNSESIERSPVGMKKSLLEREIILGASTSAVRTELYGRLHIN